MNGDITMCRADRPDVLPRSTGRLTRLEIVLQRDIDDHYHYKPGETISGLVKVYVHDGDVDLISLKININGISTVGWKASDGRTLQSREEYVNDTLPLAPLDGSSVLNLPPDEHDFNFSYQLPNRLPSSFIGKYGSVTYVVKASALYKKGPLICSEPFLVANRLFPWTNADMMKPVEAQGEKRYSAKFFQSGKIRVKISLPRTGFYPGDDIKMNVEVINGSPRTVLGIEASLLMHTAFTAQTNVHTHIQILAKRRDKWELVRGEGRRWSNGSLTVPTYTPESKLEGCDIIDIHFELMLKIEVKKKNEGESDLRIRLPVVIGPLSDLIDPSNRPRQRIARTFDRKTLENMDIEKLLAFTQDDDEFRYEAPVSDGTLRVNPLYNRPVQHLGSDDDGSDTDMNTKL